MGETMAITRLNARGLTVLAAAALAACGNSSGANDSNAAAAEITVTNAPNAATPTGSVNVAASTAVEAGGFGTDFMLGKWSAIGEDCSATLEFRKDGTVTTPIGVAKWTVAGDKLSITYDDGSTPTVSSIKVLDPARIEITHSSGTKETEKRC